MKNTLLQQSFSILKNASVKCILRRSFSNPFLAYVRQYSYRTHMCGEISQKHVGQSVTLCGWIHAFRLNKFMLLRDWTGIVQVAIPEDDNLLAPEESIVKLNVESVVQIVGEVVPRPSGQENPKIPTGYIELLPKNVEVLNSSKLLPFQMKKTSKKREPVRQKYRYLDIRTEKMQSNLRLRAKLISKMRLSLEENCFIEVETPTLFRPTPGGAQEFIVPSSGDPGKFFSLPQSPQQMKQLLMVGGIDRYYQVARCFRDEHLKSDRQFEFTQLDIEMSFVNQSEVLALTEEIVKSSWPLPILSDPFPILTYDEAMSLYGTDKPDLRYDIKLRDISHLASKTLTSLLKADFLNVIKIDDAQSHFTTNFKKSLLQSVALHYPGHSKVAYLHYTDGNWKISPSKLRFISDLLNVPELINMSDLHESDVCILSWGTKQNVQKTLGTIRNCVIDLFIERKIFSPIDDNYKFVWVVDFPLFKSENGDLLKTVHHPFTAPLEADMDKLNTEPLSVRSQAYDLVLNGQEVGGGSIRIHDAELQRHIFDLLKLDSSELFYFFEALQCGAPPHGGIALGLDRIAAILCKTETIRDVIAFPKNSIGHDTMSESPCEISKETKSHFHITTV